MVYETREAWIEQIRLTNMSISMTLEVIEKLESCTRNKDDTRFCLNRKKQLSELKQKFENMIGKLSGITFNTSREELKNYLTKISEEIKNKENGIGIRYKFRDLFE